MRLSMSFGLLTVFLLLVAAAPAFAQADPTISINDATANEGDGPSTFTIMTFTVSLSAPSQKTVTVLASTQQGTATDNADFGAGSVTITFNPGEVSSPLNILIKGDSLVEGTERFFVNLSSPVNATIGRGQGIGTIIDDDALVLVQDATPRDIVFDSVFFNLEPFGISNDLNFSSDHRTRVIVFATGLKLAAGETASAVTATAEDSLGAIRPLEVEFVGNVPNFDWLKQVVLKLNDQIAAGNTKIRITLHGVTSNAVTVNIKP